MKRSLLLLTILMAGLLALGCGETREINVTTANTGTLPGPPPISGQFGQVQFNTVLATDETVQQTAPVLFESAQVPVFVTHYRFTGFNADGTLVYGPVLRTKNASVLLSEVPVEVVNLRVELLVDILVMGGTSLTVDIAPEETFPITNPVFKFPGLIGEDFGGPGPEGPPGSEGGLDIAYGSFTFTSEQLIEVDVITQGLVGDPLEPGQLVDFPEIKASVGVTRDQAGVYSVAEDGDYLLTYSLDLVFNDFILLPSEVNAQADSGQSRFLVLVNDEVVSQSWTSTQTRRRESAESPLTQLLQTDAMRVQVVASLEAGDEVSLRYCQSCQECPETLLTQGNFTALRLGETSNSPLPGIVDECEILVPNGDNGPE